MSAKIANLKEEDGLMSFTISDIDVSYVNGMRRTILSDIPICVFKTTPYEENNAVITFNTSRLNNEIVKQRLSCIPIGINLNLENSLETIKNYTVEIDVENKTDTSMIVTTKDFKILNTSTNKYLEDGAVKKIFPPFIPPNGNGEYYIDFLRLRPRISDQIPGEKIKLSCKISVGTARDDSMFNVTGTCSYGFTPDYEKIEEQLEIRKQKWKDEGKKESEIIFEAKNWKLLEGMRYVIKNSFDFVIGTVGIYDNEQIIIAACNILLKKMNTLKNSIERDEVEIKRSDNLLENCYDVTLVNEDYTIGNILNYEIYSIFYTDLKIVNYIGFKKFHPHDSDSVLRISLVDVTKGISTIKTIVIAVIDESLKKIQNMKGCFDGSRKC
jgi:DNA-directed RNA polymerase alpha subunit